ncbi:MAG: hypothetical protein QOC69_1351 [Mycobacterium sp.]|jgi:NADPH:quinone reductase-like Zn-dependent oxidoreductase|nr:hypothetical protein [Mycobacterium sp.]
MPSNSSDLLDTWLYSDIPPGVDRTFRLDEAAAAVRYLADGLIRGKVVIAL